MNELVMRAARKRGYLVAPANDEDHRQEWLQVARAEGFPFVMVATDIVWVGSRASTMTQVVWDTAHLPIASGSRLIHVRN